MTSPKKSHSVLAMSNIRNTPGTTIWQFEDRTGIQRRGYFIGYSDFGGTDVSYHFRDINDESFHIVSGQRLKDAFLVRQ